MLCGLIPVLLFWAGHRYRVREVKAQFAAVLAERARIARDLHDTLAQGVVGISAQLQAVKARLGTAPDAASRHLDLAVEMVRFTLVEVRRSVWNMRAEALEKGNLVEALSATAKQLSPDRPIEVAVQGTPRPLAGEVESHLLHIGQEALSNAIRHAAASEIRIDVAFEGPQVRLRVQDNGRGFATDRPVSMQEGHFGLIGMRERIEKLGGRLSINSQQGRGTEVEAVVSVA